MTEFGMWMTDLRWKIDWDKTNYVQRAESSLNVPTLVFHGTSDRRVPISESRQLEARASEVVTLIETPAAGHVMSWNADPKRYERYLEGFLDRL
jgi:pimeloyl-ACP methyl ester carboxylesterase